MTTNPSAEDAWARAIDETRTLIDEWIDEQRGRVLALAHELAAAESPVRTVSTRPTPEFVEPPTVAAPLPTTTDSDPRQRLDALARRLNSHVKRDRQTRGERSESPLE